MSFLTDSILIATVLFSVFALGTSRVGMTIRIFAAQSLLLALLPVALHGSQTGLRGLALAAGTIGVKAILIPRLLFRAIRDVAIRRDVNPLIGYGSSLFAGAVLVILAFAVSSALPLPAGVASPLLVPAALSTLLLGLLLLVSRTKAVTQVAGYLIMENGIYLFGTSLLVEMPALVETGILLDVFVGVFVMGIVIFHINREFDHMDTHNLTTLRD